MRFRGITLLLLLCLASTLSAITIGELQAGGGTGTNTGIPGSNITLISMSRPAMAAGTINSATLMWSKFTCTTQVKIKTFRRVGAGPVNVIAERGPFTPVEGVNTLNLVPGINVEKGDLIGVTQLGGANCGGGTLQTDTDPNDMFGVYVGAVDPAAGTAVPSVAYISGHILNVAGSTTSEILHGYVIVAGSVRGNFGSEFKTSLQMSNPSSSEIRGRLVFHPAGVPAQDSDPSVPYFLNEHATTSYDDIVEAIGRAGLGTIDLVTTKGYPPNVSVRIFNDQGSAGTSGLTEQLKTPGEVILAGQRGTLSIPSNLTNFRLNIGYRTLAEGATVSVDVYDAFGASIPGNGVQSFAANTFNQLSGSQFTNRPTLPPGGMINFTVISGSIYVYGAVTDNRTNDGNLTFAKKF